MVFHMKTTLVIDDQTMMRLREKAAREDRTLSELVEAALRLLLDCPSTRPRRLPPLPSYAMGEPLIDVARREEIDRLDKEKAGQLYGAPMAAESAPANGATRGRARKRRSGR